MADIFKIFCPDFIVIELLGIKWKIKYMNTSTLHNAIGSELRSQFSASKPRSHKHTHKHTQMHTYTHTHTHTHTHTCKHSDNEKLCRHEIWLKHEQSIIGESPWWLSKNKNDHVKRNTKEARMLCLYMLPKMPIIPNKWACLGHPRANRYPIGKVMKRAMSLKTSLDHGTGEPWQ